jgi:hypothetical protein
MDTASVVPYGPWTCLWRGLAWTSSDRSKPAETQLTISYFYSKKSQIDRCLETLICLLYYAYQILGNPQRVFASQMSPLAWLFLSTRSHLAVLPQTLHRNCSRKSQSPSEWPILTLGPGRELRLIWNPYGPMGHGVWLHTVWPLTIP